MLGLPKSTEVNRRVAKEKLYANANIPPQLREVIKDHVEAVYWRNKLAESTFNVSGGKFVTEIQVFEVRQRNLDKRVLSAINKSIPYKILFVLTYEAEAQLWIDAEGALYNTSWQPLSDYRVTFNGLSLDAVYESLARQISGGRLGASKSIGEAVDRDKRRQRLERDIAALEKKLLREKQFNKQVEVNSDLKRLKKELEETTHG